MIGLVRSALRRLHRKQDVAQSVAKLGSHFAATSEVGDSNRAGNLLAVVHVGGQNRRGTQGHSHNFAGRPDARRTFEVDEGRVGNVRNLLFNDPRDGDFVLVDHGDTSRCFEIEIGHLAETSPADLSARKIADLRAQLEQAIAEGEAIARAEMRTAP